MFNNCGQLFYNKKCVCTLGQGASADVGGHAAALGVARLVVAGVNLDLVAGEVFQVGDHRRLLTIDRLNNLI